MDKQYLHTDHEQRIYQLWQDNNSFSPTKNPEADPFTIIMPPPNANDPLHVGHAMFVALEDIITRYQRMKGKSVLWLPGTDHAGIETQFVFEKKLSKEKKSRFDFDRETLYQMIWDYTQENSDTAINQIKQLGASADWSRFKFMLDPDIVATVLDTFKKMYKDGLIYRSFRLVNYCTFCGTAFSALETDHQEKTSPFYQIKYGPFVIGTVRPETKFRDTALAVNPKDPRYQEHIGKTFEIMGLLGPIKMKVIADDEVDPDFGTGIMKVTPAHDPHDFELGQKYNLPITPIIDINGRMDFSWYLNDSQNTNPKYLERANKYHGLKVNQMREVMKVDLEADGLLVDYNPQYRHTIGCCYRCQRPLEPLPLPQFYVKVKPLVKPILEALNKKQITVHGSGHDKILKHWLKNLNDWNISRQIVWGIRIPVWYKIEKDSNIQVSFIDKDNNLVRGLLKNLLNDYSLNDIRNGLQTLSAPVDADFVVSESNPGDEYLQETDTFDTWFSSAQWPFSTLMNSQPGDYDKFYPTQVMETGYDILPFWVMRMLMVGKYITNKLPFDRIYLHGLIRDPKGQKMSKSKGNVINPITVVEKYGADALRMALVIRSSPGLDKNVGEAEFRAMRNFTNKIWNAARFVDLSYHTNFVEAGPEDDNFITTINQHIKDISRMLEQYKLGLAAETVYNNFWHWYCDEQIELNKQGRLSTKLLLKGLLTYLKLLHPFMPFVSEAVYQEIKPQLAEGFGDETLLITSDWPQSVNK